MDRDLYQPWVADSLSDVDVYKKNVWYCAFIYRMKELLYYIKIKNKYPLNPIGLKGYLFCLFFSDNYFRLKSKERSCNYASIRAYVAFSSMNSLRGATSSPMSIEKILSASAAFSIEIL